MTPLIIHEDRPGYADHAEVNGISVNVYKGKRESTCLVIPPYSFEWESPDITFTETDLRDLAAAATWAADKLKEHRELAGQDPQP